MNALIDTGMALCSAHRRQQYSGMVSTAAVHSLEMAGVRLHADGRDETRFVDAAGAAFQAAGLYERNAAW